MSPSGIFLLAAAFICLVSLVRIRSRAIRLRSPIQPSVPRGSAAAGIRYAFSTAFAPWAKESTRRHLPTYLAGVVYHLAVFTMLVMLILSLVPIAVPSVLSPFLTPIMGFGLLCGIALLVKRWSYRNLRAISVADDYLSNLLVNAALAVAVLSTVEPAFISALQVAGGIMLLYAPLGKLRHMFFLLTSRMYWGKYFGARGVLPSAREGGSNA